MKVLTALATLTATATAQTATITPKSSSYILAESETNLLTAQNGGLVTITSDIPVSISRYNDDSYADGEQPILPTDAFVLVTSDCSSDTTEIVPKISWDYSKGVSVSIATGATFTSFLQPASYKAEWSWNNWGCDVYPTPAPFSSSVFSLGPTEVGQVVTVTQQGETQTLEQYQGGRESNNKPFSEEEYKSNPSGAGRTTVFLGGFVIVMVMSMNERWMTVGRVGVVALTLSPLVSRFSKGSTSKQNMGAHSTNERGLQTCTYQAEIMLDGCTHPLYIDAPMVRVVDALVVNSNSQEGTEQPCYHEYTADITFPTNTVTTFEGEGVVEIDALSYSQCVRATDGRPFIDSKGGSLLARPLVGQICESGGSCWTNTEECIQPKDFANNNTVHKAQLALGEKWTQRALGEYSSIASFSAFSIALMTNAAPSSLVEGSLVAAMDEVRHAHASFEIASKLIGREVKPGALPESTHEFHQDLVTLGLAVAREGCVDETLSAIAAAVESLELTNEQEKYASLDVTTVRWIRKELNTIAMEEATHSALAWRTLFWVCRVDKEACDVVKKEVLDVKQLNSRFDYRFRKAYEDRADILGDMKAAWKKVYQGLASIDVEIDGVLCRDRNHIDKGANVLTLLTDNILRGVLCDTNTSTGVLVHL